MKKKIIVVSNKQYEFGKVIKDSSLINAVYDVIYIDIDNSEKSSYRANDLLLDEKFKSNIIDATFVLLWGVSDTKRDGKFEYCVRDFITSIRRLNTSITIIVATYFPTEEYVEVCRWSFLNGFLVLPLLDTEIIAGIRIVERK